MNFVSKAKIELFKIKRTKTFLYSIIILIISLLWATGASMSYFSKSEQATISIIITSFTDLNTLFFPIIVSIFATKICSIEHKHHTFKFLKANGIDKSCLFSSKNSLLFINLIIISLIETLFVVVISITHKAEIDKVLLIKFIIGNILAGYILNSLFLFIALKYQNRAVALSSGIVGGFIGIVISRAPIFIKGIIPFGLVNMLSPISVKFDEKLKVLLYLNKSEIKIYFIIYLLVGIITYYFLKYKIKKEIE
ncbi:MAG: ABC transporter permease [Treponema sp.]